MRTTFLPFELDHDEIQPHHLPAHAVNGTVRLVGREIHIEFTLHGAAPDAVPRSVRIPLAHVERVSMTGGAVKSPRLLIEADSDDILSALPWSDGHMCVMRFRRAHGQRLRELIEEIEVVLAEVKAGED